MGDLSGERAHEQGRGLLVLACEQQRYERASTIVTSNRGLEEWAPLFEDALLAGAAMDRLRHHAHVIEITGDSYRNPPPGKAA